MNEKYQQARALLQSNQLSEARILYQELSLKHDGDADTWFMLGALNGMLGDHSDAEYCARKVIELTPDRAEAYFNLGISLRDQKKPQEAIEELREAINIKPDYAEAYNALGYIFALRGNAQEAEQHFRRAAELNPQYPDAYNNLGNLLRAAGRNDEAIESYRKAIEIQPNHLDAMLNLATLLSKMTRIAEAIELDRRILTLRPDYAEVHYHLGNLLLGVDDLQEALESFRRAQGIRLGFTEAIGAEAQTLQKMGLFDESYECINSALERGMSSPSIVVALSEMATRVGQQEEAIKLAEQMLQQTGLSNEEYKQLHFSVGSMYDNLECYQEAFEHYRQANSLYRGRFLRENHEQIVNGSIELFQPDRMPHLPKAQLESNLPLFIVGMPRSGTSLVEQILASHQGVFGAGELNDINQYTNDMQKRLGSVRSYPFCIGEITQAIIDSLSRRYLDRLRAMSYSAQRITDKMPHNFIHLGLIARLFPGARVIHIKRNPMDTCMSIYFHNFNELHAYAHNLSDLGFYYRCYEKLMEHWRSVLDLPMFEIQYEDLVNDPEYWIPQLVRFCRLTWDDRCLRFHETQRMVNTPSNVGVRRPMYSSSVGRWKYYEKQLEPLKHALQQ